MNRLPDNRAVFFSDFRRFIRAVVSNENNLEAVCRIILRFEAVDKVADNRFFVSGADYNGNL